MRQAIKYYTRSLDINKEAGDDQSTLDMLL